MSEEMSEEFKKWDLERVGDIRRKHGWRDAQDSCPPVGTEVETMYRGVYSERRCHFWIDGGGNWHWGRIDEVDRKGSQPAEFWRHISTTPDPTKP